MGTAENQVIKLKEQFKREAIDYHFKVSRLIGHIKENGFTLVTWLPQLEECRSILEELLLEKMDYDDLTQRFMDNHDLPYDVIDQPDSRINSLTKL
ncbi:MAG TPA: hypothetical protein VJ464_03945 [Blastocatellia bacterium]|nr:hypothetical protein [Blastocatellia bacterium]